MQREIKHISRVYRMGNSLPLLIVLLLFLSSSVIKAETKTWLGGKVTNLGFWEETNCFPEGRPKPYDDLILNTPVNSHFKTMIDSTEINSLQILQGISCVETTASPTFPLPGPPKYFRTLATGNWNATSTWESSRYGVVWEQATSIPRKNDRSITILYGHTVTVTNDAEIRRTTVDTGGQITINSEITFTIANGGDGITVYGTISNLGYFEMNNSAWFKSGSTYLHNNSGNVSAVPTATWDSTSNCVIVAIKQDDDMNLGQTFGNLTFKAPLQYDDIYLPSTINVQNNFTVQEYGEGKNLYYYDGEVSRTMTIGGNLTIQAGDYNILTKNSGQLTIDLGGNFSVSDGKLDLGEDGISILNIGGDFSLTGGDIIRSNSSYNSQINFNSTAGGTYTHSGGTFNNDYVNFTVNADKKLTLLTNIAVASDRNFTVNGTLFCDNHNVTGAGTFLLSSGATLGIGSTAGITTSGGSGNIQLTDTRTYSTGANYIYNGTSAQVTGNGLMQNTPANLTIDNSAGVTLASSALTTVSGVLTINAGKLFEINSATQLTVSGSIINNAGNSGFVFHSDASGTASLIHNTDNISATVERYISGSAEDWHFLSSPVADEEISGEWLPSGSYGNGTGYDLYLWNEPTSCWIYKLNTTSTVNWSTVHPGADFVIGRGYLYSVQASNPTKSFAGYLNNGTINYGFTVSGADSLKGFNLVGNPYVSSIDWSAASGWTRTNLIESGGGYNMWIWNPSASNYGVYNSADADGIGTNSVTRYIAPMQGFFVEAASAGDLGMSNNVRVHDGAGNWFKNCQQQINNLNLIVTSEAGFGSDEILLEFAYATKEIGAKKLFSPVTTAPALYINSDGVDLTIGHFTTPDETLMVPVNFYAGKDGDFTINCQFDMDSYEMLWLEDSKENYFIDMKKTPEYSFSARVSDDDERFVLYFGALKTYKNKELPANIYYDGNSVVVDLSLVDNNAKAQIIDLSGRVLIKKDMKGKMINKIHLQQNNQIVLVYVRTSNALICRKISLNRF